ncbi:ZirU family protein [Providencia vermicola]|uniref:ZirU family protein n=1 Tax=Providencia vermicola TaxID=333965 RepID=A0AAX3RZY6_9GAMM|nr:MULTISPECIES: ZirU family protein [Providencia]ELX8379880.1 invasin family protein [Providencia stuartii]EMD5259270.1 invasin family protein [Providencia stuartii]USB38249.1 ZirU family protein [Providencia vermicola]WFC07184.1 ZirU family protein [Providencia vermicola]
MNKNQQPNLIAGKGKLALLITGAVLSMAVSTPVLAASTTTPVSVTSPATKSVIGHAPVLKTDGQIKANDKNGDNVLGENDTLEASGFAFDDADGDKVTISYEWLADGTTIPSETSDKLILTNKLLGKTITVKAIAHTDPNATDPAESKPVGAKTYLDIKGTKLPDGSGITTVNGSVVKAVTISGLTSGKPEVGKKLTADVTCHGTCDSSKLTYQWQLESAVGSGLYSNIPSATTKEYTVKGTDQKRKIQVIVSNK